ncbi:hypothetical protein AB0I53_25080 [Saccharopolyspora sp. NPDC050389]|uniref:hypothetical protein n=1 Tax=Saccharopolyspora sp. NPDC050389 TaxID=3155516 RepID=UPI0033DFB44F
MARPPLEIGSHGKIRTYHEETVHWRAVAQVRLFDGKSRQIERSGPAERKAIKRLQSAIKGLLDSKARLTVDSTFREVADRWLDKVKKRRAATTYNTYRLTLKNLVFVGHAGPYLISSRDRCPHR